MDVNLAPTWNSDSRKIAFVAHDDRPQWSPNGEMIDAQGYDIDS